MHKKTLCLIILILTGFYFAQNSNLISQETPSNDKKNISWRGNDDTSWNYLEQVHGINQSAWKNLSPEKQKALLDEANQKCKGADGIDVCVSTDTANSSAGPLLNINLDEFKDIKPVEFKDGSTGKGLTDVSDKVTQKKDYAVLDSFYDGTVQNKNQALNLSLKDTPLKTTGLKITGKTPEQQKLELMRGITTPPLVKTSKDEENKNPEFDKVNCRFWIFGCQKMSDVEYKKVSGDVFVKDKKDLTDVHYNDVNQGGIGDCYYLASVSSIARKNPDAINNMIRQNADGTYSVDFYRKRQFWEFWKPKYTKETVTVDNQFPVDKTGSPVFAGYGDRAGNGNPEVWGMVMEKAYAKFRGSYNNISNGGFPGPAMETLTGKDSHTHLAVFTSIDKIAEWDKQGYAITAGSLPAFTNKKEVVKGHAYYIMDVDTEKKTVTLGNPWGFNHVTLTEAEFRRNFSMVSVNPVQ